MSAASSSNTSPTAGTKAMPTSNEPQEAATTAPKQPPASSRPSTHTSGATQPPSESSLASKPPSSSSMGVVPPLLWEEEKKLKSRETVAVVQPATTTLISHQQNNQETVSHNNDSSKMNVMTETPEDGNDVQTMPSVDAASSSADLNCTNISTLETTVSSKPPRAKRARTMSLSTTAKGATASTSLDESSCLLVTATEPPKSKNNGTTKANAATTTTKRGRRRSVSRAGGKASSTKASSVQEDDSGTPSVELTDLNPHRLVNPLVEWPPPSTTHPSEDPSEPSSPQHSAEVWPLSSLSLPVPDTFSLAYQARLLGFEDEPSHKTRRRKRRSSSGSTGIPTTCTVASVASWPLRRTAQDQSYQIIPPLGHGARPWRPLHTMNNIDPDPIDPLYLQLVAHPWESSSSSLWNRSSRWYSNPNRSRRTIRPVTAAPHKKRLRQAWQQTQSTQLQETLSRGQELGLLTAINPHDDESLSENSWTFSEPKPSTIATDTSERPIASFSVPGSDTCATSASKTAIDATSATNRHESSTEWTVCTWSEYKQRYWTALHQQHPAPQTRTATSEDDYERTQRNSDTDWLDEESLFPNVTSGSWGLCIVPRLSPPSETALDAPMAVPSVLVWYNFVWVPFETQPQSSQQQPQQVGMVVQIQDVLVQSSSTNNKNHNSEKENHPLVGSLTSLMWPSKRHANHNRPSSDTSPHQTANLILALCTVLDHARAAKVHYAVLDGVVRNSPFRDLLVHAFAMEPATATSPSYGDKPFQEDHMDVKPRTIKGKAVPPSAKLEEKPLAKVPPPPTTNSTSFKKAPPTKTETMAPAGTATRESVPSTNAVAQNETTQKQLSPATATSTLNIACSPKVDVKVSVSATTKSADSPSGSPTHQTSSRRATAEKSVASSNSYSSPQLDNKSMDSIPTPSKSTSRHPRCCMIADLNNCSSRLALLQLQHMQRVNQWVVPPEDYHTIDESDKNRMFRSLVRFPKESEAKAALAPPPPPLPSESLPSSSALVPVNPSPSVPDPRRPPRRSSSSSLTSSRSKKKSEAFGNPPQSTRSLTVAITVRLDDQQGKNDLASTIQEIYRMDPQRILDEVRIDIPPLHGDQEPALDILRTATIRQQQQDSVSTTAEDEDELLRLLQCYQQEVQDLEKAAEPKARNLLECVVKERMEFEESNAFEEAENEKKVHAEFWKLQAEHKQHVLEKQRQLEQDMEAVCSICNDGEVTPDNQILFCDTCNVPVHQMCYNVEQVPVGDYHCIACRYLGRDDESKSQEDDDARGKEEMTENSNSRKKKKPVKRVKRKLNELPIVCELCPIRRGAFLRTDMKEDKEKQKVKTNESPHDTCLVKASPSKPKSKGRWVHAICAKWQGLEFVDKKRCELVEDVTELKASFRKQGIRCELCLGERGSMIKCRHADCDRWMHVTCARAVGTCQVFHGEDCHGDVPDDPWTLLCPEHSIIDPEDEKPKNTLSIEQLIELAKALPPEPIPEPPRKVVEKIPFNKATREEQEDLFRDPEYERALIRELTLNRSVGCRCEICDLVWESPKDFVRCNQCREVVCRECVLDTDNVSEYGKCLTCRAEQEAKKKALTKLANEPLDSDDQKENWRPECVACFSKHGPLRQCHVARVGKWKKTKQQYEKSLFKRAKYIHFICGLWSPKIFWSNDRPGQLDLVNVVMGHGNGFINESHPCFLCGKKFGLKVRCHGNCCWQNGDKLVPKYFHVTCARHAGLEVSHDNESESPEGRWFVNCYQHCSNEHNLRAKLEDLYEIEKARIQRRQRKDDMRYTFPEGSRIMNAAIVVVKILGWAWRWAEWWVEHDSSWEPLLEPGQKEEDLSPEQLKRVYSTRESRCEDARKCRLVAFGAALRNRLYDDGDDCDRLALDRALRAVLNTPSLVGPLTKAEIDFHADWLGRAYRSKSNLLFLGDDKIPVEQGGFCLNQKDKSPKYEIDPTKVPGKQSLESGACFESGIDDVDDFLIAEVTVPERPPKSPARRKALVSSENKKPSVTSHDPTPEAERRHRKRSRLSVDPVDNPYAQVESQLIGTPPAKRGRNRLAEANDETLLDSSTLSSKRRGPGRPRKNPISEKASEEPSTSARIPVDTSESRLQLVSVNENPYKRSFLTSATRSLKANTESETEPDFLKSHGKGGRGRPKRISNISSLVSIEQPTRKSSRTIGSAKKNKNPSRGQDDNGEITDNSVRKLIGTEKASDMNHDSSKNLSRSNDQASASKDSDDGFGFAALDHAESYTEEPEGPQKENTGCSDELDTRGETSDKGDSEDAGNIKPDFDLANVNDETDDTRTDLGRQEVHNTSASESKNQPYQTTSATKSLNGCKTVASEDRSGSDSVKGSTEGIAKGTTDDGEGAGRKETTKSHTDDGVFEGQEEKTKVSTDDREQVDKSKGHIDDKKGEGPEQNTKGSTADGEQVVKSTGNMDDRKVEGVEENTKDSTADGEQGVKSKGHMESTVDGEQIDKSKGSAADREGEEQVDKSKGPMDNREGEGKEEKTKGSMDDGETLRYSNSTSITAKRRHRTSSERENINKVLSVFHKQRRQLGSSGKRKSINSDARRSLACSSNHLPEGKKSGGNDTVKNDTTAKRLQSPASRSDNLEEDNGNLNSLTSVKKRKRTRASHFPGMLSVDEVENFGEEVEEEKESKPVVRSETAHERRSTTSSRGRKRTPTSHFPGMLPVDEVENFGEELEEGKRTKKAVHTETARKSPSTTSKKGRKLTRTSHFPGMLSHDEVANFGQETDGEKDSKQIDHVKNTNVQRAGRKSMRREHKHSPDNSVDVNGKNAVATFSQRQKMKRNKKKASLGKGFEDDV